MRLDHNISFDVGQYFRKSEQFEKQHFEIHSQNKTKWRQILNQKDVKCNYEWNLLHLNW